jgi:hypothetical protein
MFSIEAALLRPTIPKKRLVDVVTGGASWLGLIEWLRHTDDFAFLLTRITESSPQNQRCYPMRRVAQMFFR